MSDKRALLNLGLAVAVAGLEALIWYSPEKPAEDADQPGLMAASRLSDLDPAEFRQFLENVSVEDFASSLEALEYEEPVDEDDEDDEESG